MADETKNPETPVTNQKREGQPFAPVSALNQMRREAVEQLVAKQTASCPAVEVDDPATVLAEMRPVPVPACTGEPELHLLVRSPEQLSAALQIRPASITLDYLDLYGLRPSVERIKSSGIRARVASPRVLKPGEERILQFLLSLDCAILVNQHECAGLIQMCDRETDTELHRSDRQAPFLMPIFLIPFGNFLSSPDEGARLLQLAPNGQDAVVCNFLPVMSGVGLPYAAIKISLAHHLRGQPEAASDSIQDFLNDQHSLRPAKSTKRGVRRKICFGDLSAKFHGGDIIGVVQVKKRAVGDGLRQIHGPAAVGSQVHSGREQMPLLIKADLELR